MSESSTFDNQNGEGATWEDLSVKRAVPPKDPERYFAEQEGKEVMGIQPNTELTKREEFALSKKYDDVGAKGGLYENLTEQEVELAQEFDDDGAPGGVNG